jgi:hypothetical protein
MTGRKFYSSSSPYILIKTLHSSATRNAAFSIFADNSTLYFLLSCLHFIAANIVITAFNPSAPSRIDATSYITLRA